MIELLQNYCDNVIKEEIDVLSKTSLRELYKAAFDYKREVIEQDFGDRTSDEQFQAIYSEIKLLDELGLSGSENYRTLVTDQAERKKINKKYQESEDTKNYLKYLQSYFGDFGFLAMSFRQFAKALGGRYRLTTLKNYQGKVSSKEIQKLSGLRDSIFRMESDNSQRPVKKAKLNTLREGNVTGFDLDGINASYLLQVIYGEYQGDQCLVDWLQTENCLFQASHKIDEKHVVTLDCLDDNDLFQLFIDSGNLSPQANLIYVMDYPGSPDEITLTVNFIKPNDFLVAIPKSDVSGEFPPIIFQTFWDGVIVEEVLGYDQLKMINYNRNTDGLVVE